MSIFSTYFQMLPNRSYVINTPFPYLENHWHNKSYSLTSFWQILAFPALLQLRGATRPSSGEWDIGNFARASGKMLFFTDKKEKTTWGTLFERIPTPTNIPALNLNMVSGLQKFTLWTMKLQLWSQKVNTLRRGGHWRRNTQCSCWVFLKNIFLIVELLNGTTPRLCTSRLLLKKTYILMI